MCLIVAMVMPPTCRNVSLKMQLDIILLYEKRVKGWGLLDIAKEHDQSVANPQGWLKK
jgi:hypothetical protein